MIEKGKVKMLAVQAVQRKNYWIRYIKVKCDGFIPHNFFNS